MPEPSVVPGAEPSFWLRDAPPDDETPPLDRDLEADVVVVGGGYTGLWTALALRERAPDRHVTLLEAEHCGWGPSGRNGGFCHGYWSYLPTLLELFPRERALELCRAGDRIVPGIRTFLEARGEDAWLREGGLLKVSTTPAQDASVERAVAAAREAGHPEEAVAVEEPGISPAFRSGVFYRDGATVHPGRLVRALRRAALEAGVELHERTPVEQSDNLSLSANGCRIRAREVVVATNAAAAEWGPARGHVTVFGSYVVLTEPVPELLAEIGWTGGEAIMDARMFLHYFRTTEDGRVLMGSGSGPIGHGARIDRRFTHDAATAGRAERGLRRLLPGLAEAKVEAAWGGPIDVAADHLPFLGTLPGSRVHYALGYSGHGVGPSWLAGQALASLVLGADDEWARLPLVSRRVARVPREPFRRLGGGAIRAAILACEEADEEERRAPLAARVGAAVPRALGMRLGQR
ncbi:MAG TPA: FAD-dependent oxidoreductase [Gaiellaceae bacterium]|nr:FAD-dependent oxidoreductase [Gaiellaceae bacterium]